MTSERNHTQNKTQHTSEQQRPRKPAAFDPDDPGISETSSAPEDQSAGDSTTVQTDLNPAPAAAKPAKRRMGWGGLLVTALIGLTTLSAGLWFTRFTSVALARDDWLGWTAKGLVALAGIAAVALVIKEFVGFARLSRLTRMRRDAQKAVATRDPKLEQKVVGQLKAHASGSRKLKWDLERFREEERHMRQPSDLLRLADRTLLEAPDRQARTIIYESARRVGVVTAVVPIAFLVVLIVLFENLRMIRRLAGAFGGRPGFFGGLRLFSWIIGHMVATGAIALTDDLWGQFLGQDVARRVSRRLGEGAFNGAMTARLGIAALQVCRPLPYIDARPPRIRDVLREMFPNLSPSTMKNASKTDAT